MPSLQALIPLATDNTDVGKVKAAQALAKIAITSNPEIAFPGERVKKNTEVDLIKSSKHCMLLDTPSRFGRSMKLCDHS